MGLVVFATVLFAFAATAAQAQTATPSPTPTPGLRYLRCETNRQGGRLAALADGVTPPGADSFIFDDRYEVSADLNDDGISDLVAVDDAGDVVVLLTDPVSFEAGICTGLTEIIESLDLAVNVADVAKFESGVSPDIAVLDNRSVRVLFNRLSSSSSGEPFVPGVARATGTDPLSMVAADFDQDGTADWAVGVASGGASLEVLYGGGNDVTTLQITVTPDVLAAGDFNLDDRLDLVALTEGLCSVGGGTNNARTLLRSPTNSRSFDRLPPFCVTRGRPSAVTVANFDRLAGDDLAVLQADRNEVVILLSVLVGQTVEFDEAARLSTASSPTAVSAGDFNLDGRIDLAVAATEDDEGVVQLFLGDGDGTFTLADGSRDPCADGVAGGCALEHLPGPMTLAFLDADAAPDIVVAADSSTCVGDCNDRDCVSDAEVERIAEIVVGNLPLSACPNADANGDGMVSVDEQTRASINAASCSDDDQCTETFTQITFLLSDNAPPTPPPTRTITATRTGTRTASGTPTATGTPGDTATRTITGTLTRTATPIPTKTCSGVVCVQGDSCAVVATRGGGRNTFAPFLLAGLLALLRARKRRTE